MEKYFALLITLFLTTYVVLNMSYFSPTIPAVENFSGSSSEVYIFSPYTEEGKKFSNKGNFFQLFKEKISFKLASEGSGGYADKFTISVKCSKNNDKEGIDGVLAAPVIDQPLSINIGGQLYISIPFSGKIGIKQTLEEEWTVLDTQVFVIGQAAIYSFEYVKESAGNIVLNVYVNEKKIGYVDLFREISSTSVTVTINENGEWKSNLFWVKIYEGSVKSNSELNGENYSNGGGQGENRGTVRESPELAKLKQEFHDVVHENKLYDCLLQMRLQEPLLTDRQILDMKSGCFREYSERNLCVDLHAKETLAALGGAVEKIVAKISKFKELVAEKKEKYLAYPPEAFLRKGEYVVYVFIDSRVAREVGFHGQRSYGKNREYARNVFIANFPGVPVPLVFDDNYTSCISNDPGGSKCPFVITRYNPCKTGECSRVNWDTATKLPQKCRDSIDYYCKINAYRDDACRCWRKDASKRPECVKYRAKFANLDSNICTADIFNIEDHPDFRQYVRKDQIPCYGCNL